MDLLGEINEGIILDVIKEGWDEQSVEALKENLQQQILQRKIREHRPDFQMTGSKKNWVLKIQSRRAPPQ